MHHVRHGETELAGAVAVDVDIERGKVHLLLELQIAQRTQLGQLRPDLLRIGVDILQIGSLHVHLNRRGRTEAHHLGNDVAGFEGDLAVGQLPAQALAELFAQRFAARSVRFQRDLDDGVLRSAGEQVDQVHRVTGGDEPFEIAGDGDVVLAGRALNHVEGVKHDPLGFLDARAGRSAQADAQQRGVGVRKQFRPHPRQQNVQQADGGNQINEDQRPAEPQDTAQITAIEGAQMAEEPLTLFAAMRRAHQPGREHRDQAAGKQVGRDHGERRPPWKAARTTGGSRPP